MRQTVIKSLSANGSSIFPMRVTLFLLRARNPSKKSVKDAIEKQIVAKRQAILPGENKRMNKTGIKAIRIRVKMLGKFNI